MRIERGTRAVVTGGGSGFGRALAFDLAARGARVLVSDVDEASADKVCDELRENGAIAAAQRCDVAEMSEVDALRDRAETLWGGTDFLANNAGLAVVGKLEEIPIEDFRVEMDVNLWGVIYGCRAFLPEMKRAKKGAILNVASAAGLLCPPMMGPYNITKAGVVALSETLRAETKHDGITVTVLCPTFFRTNIAKSTRSSDPRMTKLSSKLVDGSRWSAEKVAKVALRGVESGALYVIPQADGKVMWRAKRALGSAFFDMLGTLNNSRVLDRFAGRGAK